MTLDPLTVDDLAAFLDKRGEPWDLYRVWDRSWCCKLGQSGDRDARTFTAPTILEALRAGVDAGPPLPVVPRRPTLLHRPAFTAIKVGSKWSLHYECRSAGVYNQATRRACEEAADRAVAAREAEFVAWTAEHGPKVAGKVEGVDFRWRDW